MKNKKNYLGRTIDTRLAIIIIVIFIITIGTITWNAKEDLLIPTQLQPDTNIKKQTAPQFEQIGHYTNSDYGFTLDLPYELDKYIVQVTPNTVARISFLLPATNQKFLEYTGHAVADAFSILAYPKSEISEIKNRCEQNNAGNNLSYDCILNDEDQITENDKYSFYYVKGGWLMKDYPQALENIEYEKSKTAVKSIEPTSASLIFDSAALHTHTDQVNSFEIKYPADWKASGANFPSIHKQDLIHLFSTSGQVSDKTSGALLFGKYSIYNNKLPGSIDGNVNYLDSKINIIGPSSKFKEVKIDGGRAFYSTIQTSIASNERDIYIVGKNVIFNGNISINAEHIGKQELAKFAEILSYFKFIQPSPDNFNLPENPKISNFEDWHSYRDKTINASIKYPSEFHLSTHGGSNPGFTFYYLNPDNLKRSSNNGFSLANISISLERKKTILQYINDFKNVLNDLKQEQIQINNVPANKLTYINISSGETSHKILIPRGLDLIVISYLDGGQLENTFSKMLSTISIF